MLIDAHAHVNFNAFKKDAAEVIRRALDNDTWVNNVGSQFTTSKRAVEMAEQYEKGVYACVGLHPIHLSDVPVDEDEVQFVPHKEEFNTEAYKKLAESKKVVGIGECGLDYFHLDNVIARSGATKQSRTTTGSPHSPEGLARDDEISKQKEVFIAHIKLAKELDLPLMLHCRGSKSNPEDAYEDMLEILKDFSTDSSPVLRTPSPQRGEGRVRGMIHCFGSNLKIAQQFVDLGFYVGFTGIVTFPNAKQLQEVARELPLDRIITETDCPYLAPVPMRGKQNEPLYVKYVVAKIAELKGTNPFVSTSLGRGENKFSPHSSLVDIKNLSVGEVAKATFDNALRLFDRI